MATRWTCPNCKTLLGVRDGDLLRIRYKEATYTVSPGKDVEATCRNCGKRVTAP